MQNRVCFQNASNARLVLSSTPDALEFFVFLIVVTLPADIMELNFGIAINLKSHRHQANWEELLTINIEVARMRARRH